MIIEEDFYLKCFEDIARILGYELVINGNNNQFVLFNPNNKSYEYKEIINLNYLHHVLDIIAFTKDKRFKISNGLDPALPKGVYWITDEVSPT